jgi:hypothetical protein
MEYTSNEKQILSLMERTDFRNLGAILRFVKRKAPIPGNPYLLFGDNISRVENAHRLGRQVR